MRNLYIDFDGVIMDTITTINRIMKELHIDERNPEEVLQFYETLNWKNILAITPEINDGIACIQKILDADIFDIAILTHVNSLDEVIEKVFFLRKYFGNITIIPVPKKISKTKMVHAEDAILVDDYSGNLREWEEAGGIGVRFNLRLNGKGFRVIDRLDQLLELDFTPNLTFKKNMIQ